MITLSLNAQDWSLFPSNQGNYYSIKQYNFSDYSEYESIHYWIVDSVKQVKHEKVFYLNSKFLPENYLQCYDTNYSFYGEQSFGDSLKLRNDTIFFKNKYSDKSFYFLPKAKLGDSWFIKPKSVLDSIKITFEKKELASFLGETDSVKHYSFEAIGVHKDSTNLDEQKMLLSKNYGLINYIDFYRLINLPNLNYFHTYQLVGFEKDNTNIGYLPPDFETFLPYNEGDVLLWQQFDREAFGPNGFTNYFADTITSVVKFEDSLHYYYNRTQVNALMEILDKKTQLMQSYIFSHFDNITNVKPNLWGYGKGTVSQQHQPDSTLQSLFLWDYINQLVDNDGNTIITARSPYFNNHIDTTLCESGSTGIASYFIFDSKRGLIENTFDYFDQRFGGFRLIASNIAGEVNGSFDLFVGIEEVDESFHSVTISPNPANQQLFIKNIDHLVGLSYSIINLNGELIESGVLEKDVLNISNLKSSVYFLKLNSNRKTSTIKFVIQNF